MHQTSGATSVNHHFVDGSSTQAGTVVTADWLNTVQDEICNVILSQGISLNQEGSDDCKQLTGALQKMIKDQIVAFATDTSSDMNYLKWIVKCLVMLGGAEYPNFPTAQMK